MQRKLFILFMIFNFAVSFGQMRNRFLVPDVERYKLKGKVKSLKYVEYEPRFSSDSTYKLKVFDFLSMANNKVFFNKDGYLLEKNELTYDIHDAVSISAIWKYKYDNKNRITQEIRIPSKSGDTTTWKYDYVGDSITIVRQCNKTYKILYYKYLQRKNLELLTTANSDSSYRRKIIFKYDSKNRLIRQEDYENSDTIHHLKIITYKGKILDSDFYDDRKYRHKILKKYKYDAQGNVIEISNEKSLTGKFVYIYDKQGNWVEEKLYNASGKLYNVYRREIEYY